MIRMLAAAALAGLLGGCGTLVSNERAEIEQAAASAATQILVTIAAESPASALGLVGAPGQAYQRRRGYGPSPAVERSLDRLARDYGMRRVRGWPVRSIGAYCEVFEIPPGGDPDVILERLAADARIEIAQRMQIFETLGTRYNDPYADLQTSVTALSVEPAHRIATGRGVRVAVIDSQVDSRHPELRSSVRFTHDFVGSRLISPPEIHGTAVAGVIASTANNTEGIVGIAPDVEIAALRACWSDDSGGSLAHCTTFSLAQALEVALELEVAVINLSLSGPPDPLLAQMLDAAIGRGVIIVAASAEETGKGPGFPANHPGVIAARQTADGIVASTLWVLAPGREILTTTPEAGYAFFTGNSLAAAHVTGVAALLLERNPAFDASGVAALLNATAGIEGAAGSINACRALATLVPDESCTDAPPDSAIASVAR